MRILLMLACLIFAMQSQSVAATEMRPAALVEACELVVGKDATVQYVLKSTKGPSASEHGLSVVLGVRDFGTTRESLVFCEFANAKNPPVLVTLLYSGPCDECARFYHKEGLAEFNAMFAAKYRDAK
jgi:hypothetical protein